MATGQYVPQTQARTPDIGRTGYSVGQMDPALQQKLENDRQRQHEAMMQQNQLKTQRGMQREQIGAQRDEAAMGRQHQENLQVREQQYMNAQREANEQFQADVMRYRDEIDNRKYERTKKDMLEFIEREEEVERQYMLYDDYETELQMLLLTKEMERLDAAGEDRAKVDVAIDELVETRTTQNEIFGKQKEVLSAQAEQLDAWLTSYGNKGLPLQDAWTQGVTSMLRGATGGKVNSITALRDSKVLETLGPQEIAGLLQFREGLKTIINRGGQAGTFVDERVGPDLDLMYYDIVYASRNAENPELQRKAREALHVYKNKGPEAEIKRLEEEGVLRDKNRRTQYMDDTLRKIYSKEFELGIENPQMRRELRQQMGQYREQFVDVVKAAFGGHLSDDEVKAMVDKAKEAALSDNPPDEIIPLLDKAMREGVSPDKIVARQAHTAMNDQRRKLIEAMKQAKTPDARRRIRSQQMELRDNMKALRGIGLTGN